MNDAERDDEIRRRAQQEFERNLDKRWLQAMLLGIALVAFLAGLDELMRHWVG